MEVYLLPVGGERYELYYEVAAQAPVPQDAAPHGVWRWAVDRFRAVVAAVEREEQRRRHHPPADNADPAGFRVRLKRRALGWMAGRIAEQRLLWHLRQVDRAAASYPADLQAAPALVRILKMLARDRDRHRRWLVVNAAAFLASGLLMPIPGPNLVAYYFAFRLVGHFLSMRGAQNGLAGVEWDLRACEALVALRQVAALAPDARDARVREIAARLALHGLPRFYLRTVATGA
jgi:hypothetical protein